MKQSHIVWDEQTLDSWLKNPRAFIPGNRMFFRGVPRQTHLQDLIAYLRQVSKAGGIGQGPSP
jgi:cytochrome c